MKRRTKKLPGLRSGSADVYSTKRQTRTKESHNRDIYNIRDTKRSNRAEITGRKSVFVLSFITFIVATLLAGVLIGTGAYGRDYMRASNYVNRQAESSSASSSSYSGGGLVDPSTFSSSQSTTSGLMKKPRLNYSIGDYILHSYFGRVRAVFTWAIGLIAALIVGFLLYRRWVVHNLLNDNSDINDYEADASLQLPEELALNYDIFPDAGAHSSVHVTAVLSHIMANNKGVNTVDVYKRYKKDTVETFIDPDTNEEYTEVHRKGDIMLDQNSEPIKTTVPMFDKDYGNALFEASFIDDERDSQGKPLRRFYRPDKLVYNPKHVRGKADFNMVADFVNHDWVIPWYETQRPAGFYIVDTQPNNTMVLAMTRAGKGQTIIEPTLDAWTREKELQNFVANDPKGELYVKFFYAARRRGMDTVSFNLIDPVKTNIYNPLGYAVDAARRGDNGSVEDFVNSIGNVFFPTEGADDPMWPNAAKAAFKRSAFGLIEYYMEEDREMHAKAFREQWNPDILSQRLDELWGHVTPYNVYQMMTQLASKKSNDADFIHIEEDDPSDEKDYLTLFFDATNALPTNKLRSSVRNQDSMLRSMAGSEKTIASVYGIALTAMLFFTDDKISRLTSGRPSQNFDMEGLAFPRRFGVQFDTDYMKKYGYRGQSIKWTCYYDSAFTKQYKGADYEHTGVIDSNGWARAYFKGKFKNSKTYLRLDVIDFNSHLTAGSYYFEFIKGYEKTLDGRAFVEDPVVKGRIVRNGYFRELKPDRQGKMTYRNTTLRKVRYSLVDATKGQRQVDDVNAFVQIDIHYTERTKGVFFITPPHLMQYAKIILILLDQMFNVQVSSSYLTKENQKPLYITRYMLDEVGNLQSDGKGIPNLQTKESIGLGQSQQYTLILQTLQQLKDVYNDSIDKILQGNTGNIVYLKSTDDSMLTTLEGLSGKRHESRRDGKTVSVDESASNQGVDSKVSYNINTKEVPVITKNDMLFIDPNNAMVFSAGHMPIWSKNQLALPMSWRLEKDRFNDSRVDYSLVTVPTPVNTDSFDVRANQPNFIKMVSKRVLQARKVKDAIRNYKDVYHKTDDDISRLDPEDFAKTIMTAVNEMIAADSKARTVQEQRDAVSESEAAVDMDNIDTNMLVDMESQLLSDDLESNAQANPDLQKSLAENGRIFEKQQRKVYADHQVSHSDLANDRHALDNAIIKAYDELRGSFAQDDNFNVDTNNNLLSADTSTTYIESMIGNNGYAKDVDAAKNAHKDGGSLKDIPGEKASVADDLPPYEIKEAFIDFLLSRDTWAGLCHGKFDELVGRYYRDEIS